MAGDRKKFLRRRLVAAAILVAGVALVVVLLSGGGSDQPEQVDQGAKASSTPDGHPPARPGHKRLAPVPVLMYHGVEAPIPGGLPDLFVEPRNFRAQMDALAHAGAHAVTMAQMEAAWTRGMPLPHKPVVLTFDDGYRGQVDNALPVMRRHGWPGVLYMCIANFRPATGLTDKDVRTLLRADWELGAHTFSHSDLRTLGAPELRHEVGGSRTWLERRFGVRVNSFAYPAGMYNAAALQAVRRGHFHTAVTVAPGLAKRDHPLELNRIRVNRGMTASMLVSELRGLGWR